MASASSELRDMKGLAPVYQIQLPYLKARMVNTKTREIIQEKVWIVFQASEKRLLEHSEIKDCKALRTALESYHIQNYERGSDDILLNESLQLKLKLDAFREKHPDINIVGFDDSLL